MNHDRYNVPAAQKAPSRPGWGLGCGPGQSRAATPRGLQSFPSTESLWLSFVALIGRTKASRFLHEFCSSI